MALRNPMRFAGRREAMSSSAPTDPSAHANLNRSTAQGDAAAHGTAVLHSLGRLELPAVAASVTAPAASSTAVP
eukprot:5920671-Prymnesium_polylepis.1